MLGLSVETAMDTPCRAHREHPSPGVRPGRFSRLCATRLVVAVVLSGLTSVAHAQDPSAGGDEEPSLTEAEREAINSEYLSREFRPRMLDIRRCYERIQLTEPTAAGRFVIELEIDWEGRPATPVFTENEVGRAMASCARQVIEGWTFAPPPFGGVTVHKTLFFAPSTEAVERGVYDGDEGARRAEETALQVQSWMVEAEDWMANGEFGRAIGVLLRARSQAPTFSGIHLMLYEAYLGMGNAAQSAASLSRFLELAPDDAYADRYREVLVQLEAGELPAAVQR